MYELLKSRIKAALEKAGHSANSASIVACVDRGYIGKIGKLNAKGTPVEPGALSLKRIATTLNVPPSWLIDAIDADEAEVARGTTWPPPDEASLPPKLGQFVDDPDELTLLTFWSALETPEARHLALGAIRGIALNAKNGRDIK